MVAEAVAINALPAETVRAFALDWAPGAAAPVLASHLGGGAPDVIVSCDCIFADLFDRHFLLLDVLAEIAAPATAILLGFERRPGDGVERFFAQAAARGFRTTLRRRCQRVLVCELRLDPSASRPVELDGRPRRGGRDGVTESACCTDHTEHPVNR